ncbi:T9SS type A sorting domain-containing protein [Neolewinella aurantiaca]|uniref:T9SS type A sorting domain-containing protein n=1 Tax=Neolewinella aurantiaca TaxID=2602767 RepID=A0A5C7FGZ7_9BACT|nr:T9SS type A sorting domain-containing protein [Neolewinella aurantiaca]TXF89674.1 T9SS type A sorting domain-containing protein [Neolewinella aurantiaca]
MAKSLLVSLLVFCLAPMAAQVTLSNDYFPVAGDTLKYNTVDSAYLSTLVIAEAGANLSWNFGVPPINEERADAVTAIGSDTSFLGADLKILTGDDTESYYSVSDTEFNLVGIKTSFAILPNFQISTPADPARPTRRAPLNYLDTYETVTVNSATIAVDSLPDEALDLIGDAIANVDSMRLTTTSTRTDEVDAYGSLTIDGETYTVLREVRTESVFIQLEIQSAFLPWTDVTGTITILDPTLAGFVGPQDITKTYYFWSPEIIEPIVEITTLEQTGEIQRMDFRRRPRTVSTEGPGLQQAQVKVYPNPASQLATFEFTGLDRGEYTLSLFNMNGRMVESRTFSPIGDQTRLNVEVTDLPKGLYLYNLRNALGRTITTKRLVVGAE